MDAHSLANAARRRMPELVRKHDPGHALFAYVVQRGHIIAASHNLTGRIHSLPLTASPCSRYGYKRDSVHAEVAATRKALGRLDRRKPWHIVVMRLAGDGSLRLAKPCPICQSYLRANGCTLAMYSDNRGELERLPLE
jgi:tRNA(Arg) A34 adenosine deaminase TadA